MSKRILITGATGFIGGALTARCVADGLPVRVATRKRQWPSEASSPTGIEIEHLAVEPTENDWNSALTDRDVVVHCAARVHLAKDHSDNSLEEYRRANTVATMTLARRAAVLGVRRFVYISTIKVNGSETMDRPFTAVDLPHPDSPYALSKLEAELELKALATTSGMEVVIIRPPLVYGPAASGNFAVLRRMLERGIPLPLGAVNNQRSLVALGNVVDLIATCIDHPRAANQILLVSDGEDLSTTELVRRMAKSIGRPARLFPVPHHFLRRTLAMVGAAELAQKLLGSLQVDISETRKLLNWNPVLSVEEGLKRAMEGSATHQPSGARPASSVRP